MSRPHKQNGQTDVTAKQLNIQMSNPRPKNNDCDVMLFVACHSGIVDGQPQHSTAQALIRSDTRARVHSHTNIIISKSVSRLDAHAAIVCSLDS